MNIFIPKVILKKEVYVKLLNHVYVTNFQYETGGILLGYRCLGIFYVVALTFPRCLRNKRKMTFILHGEEHTKEMERIRKDFFVPPKFLGVWHSHITGDTSLSVQDRESNKLLISKFGSMLSVIITQQGMDGIQMTPYYISKKGEIHLWKRNKCKNKR